MTPNHGIQEMDNEVEQFEATLVAMDAVGGENGKFARKFAIWVWVKIGYSNGIGWITHIHSKKNYNLWPMGSGRTWPTPMSVFIK